MTQPLGTDSGRLDDLWRPGVRSSYPDAYSTTQPLPVSPGGGEPGSDPPPRTPPGGLSRSRNRRARRRFGSMLFEILLAVLVSAGTAAAMGWTVLRHLHRVIPGSGTDQYAQLWSLAWSGHALRPGSGVGFTQLFDGNAFYPADYSLAFGDSLLGYGPITWPFDGAAGLVTAYNLIFVFGPALSSLGAYALARQLGAHPVGAAVAGAGFTYAPWHFGQFSHLGVLSTGPLVLALALLARGHGLTMSGRAVPRRPLWALLGWVVGAWQLTIGFGHGLPFAYLLAVIGVLTLLIVPVRRLRARRRDRGRAVIDPYADPYAAAVRPVSTPAGERPADLPRRTGLLVTADLVGAGLFVVAGALMAYPFLRVEAIDPQAVAAARGLAQVRDLSPAPIGLVTPPAVSGTWSRVFLELTGNALGTGSSELRWLPGAVLLALAVLGLALSTWRWWWRTALLVGGGLIVVLSLGEQVPAAWFPGPDSPFGLLRRHAPGWAADVAPGRLMVFLTLAAALLAGGAVSRLCGWGERGTRTGALRLRAVVFALLPVLVVLEGWARIPVAVVPAPPAALVQAVAPLIVLPSAPVVDAQVMFWTAGRDFPAVANGQGQISGGRITPSALQRARAELATFPDQRSVEFLRQNGFRSVVVLRTPPDGIPGPDAGQIPDPALGLTRWDLGESVLYTLTPDATPPSAATPG